MDVNVNSGGNRVHIRLAGRFDFNAHKDFRGSYDSALKQPSIAELDVDFGAVEYLDSSALGMLLMLREKAQAARKKVTLSNCRGTVKQVLEVANFGKLFDMR